MMNRNNNQEYNGHKNWEYWNVSLWLDNSREFDRYFADIASNNEIFERHTTLNVRETTRKIIDYFGLNPNRNWETGRITSYQRTPDGARYTFGAVMAAVENKIEDYELY